MATQETRVRSVQDLDCLTVDADFHLTEQMSDLVNYLDEPYARYLQGGSDSFSEDSGPWSPFPSPATAPSQKITGRQQVFTSDAVRNSDDVQEGLDLLGVDRALLTPGAVMLRLSAVLNDDIAAALATACNRFVLDQFLDDNPDIAGAITVAGQYPERAAEEIDEHADEKQMSAVYLPVAGLNPPLGDRRYEPIYEACERHDLPFVMHSSGGTATMKSFPVQYDWFQTGLETHLIGHPLQQFVNLLTMVSRGIPERFDIDFVVQEAGIGWIPYLAYRLDFEFYAQQDQAPLLTKKPSEYLKEDFYYTSQPLEGVVAQPEYVCQMVRLMDGVNSFMWSSDYPHQDFDHTDTIFQVLAREFDADELAKLFGDNANEVFF